MVELEFEIRLSDSIVNHKPYETIVFFFVCLFNVELMMAVRILEWGREVTYLPTSTNRVLITYYEKKMN